MKKLAVMLPTFNCTDFIEQSLSSLIGQSFKDFDIFILDDGSTDGTYEILCSYADRFKNITLSRNEKNKGIIFSRNELLNQCKQDYSYLAKMDSDDVCHLRRFEIQMAFMESNPHIDIVSSNIEIIPARTRVTYSDNVRHVNESLMLTNIINNSSSLFRSAVLYGNNISYDENYKGASDYKFWSELSSRRCSFHILDDFLIQYRRHNTQESTVNKTRQRRNGLRVAQENIQRLKISAPDSFIEKLRENKLFTKTDRQEAVDFYHMLRKQNRKIGLYDNQSFKEYTYHRIQSVLNHGDALERSKIMFYTYPINYRNFKNAVNLALQQDSTVRTSIKLLQKIKREKKEKKILIYGDNGITNTIIQLLSDKTYPYEIEACLDSFAPTEGRPHHNLTIYGPRKIHDLTSKTIVIGSINHKEAIINGLKANLLEQYDNYEIISL